ncbi:TPA: VaFE repeat-containing surface-anchored protein [Listeria monocytogenes]
MLKGWQMIKNEKVELIINGELIENDYSFTADSEKMEVQISFTFDASELGGKQIVTFEGLYDMSNLDEPIKVAEHEDIEDEGQTITITEATKPEEPNTQDTPKPNTPKTSDLPNTGDTQNPAIFILGMVISITALGVVYFRRKKSKS